jgi:hypothetical protein
LKQYFFFETRIKDVDERDKIRNFKLPIDGQEIMTTFNLTPCKQVGLIKEAIKNAILEGIIRNDYEEARVYMFKVAQNVLK